MHSPPSLMAVLSWVAMNASPHTSSHSGEICLFGSLGSSGLSAPYPLLVGFIRCPAQECSAPSLKDLRLYSSWHPSASTAASGSGGLASAPAFNMRVACSRKACGGIAGGKRGTPFRRAGVSHRPDVRVRARGTHRHAVCALSGCGAASAGGCDAHRRRKR